MNEVYGGGMHLIRASTASFDSLLSIDRELLRPISCFYFGVGVS